MNVEIGAEAALFPEKEYINGIAVAVLVLRTIWPPRVHKQKTHIFIYKFQQKIFISWHNPCKQ